MLILSGENYFSHDHLSIFSRLRKKNRIIFLLGLKFFEARDIKFGRLSVDKRIIGSPCWCFRFQFWSIYVPSWMFYWNWRIHNLNQNHFTMKKSKCSPFLHIYFQNERHQFDWIQWQNKCENHMERNAVLSNSNLNKYSVCYHTVFISCTEMYFTFVKYPFKHRHPTSFSNRNKFFLDFWWFSNRCKRHNIHIWYPNVLCRYLSFI